MKILVAGGGSGGHITPVVAVVREVLNQKPRTQIEFWTDKKYYGNVVKITTELEDLHWGGEEKNSTEKNQYIRVRKISAGKFRRYKGMSASDYLANGGEVLRDVTFGNIAGFFGFMTGIFQSFFRLAKKSNRPDVMFLKGGFVCLPIGIVARWFKIPYVIHESDAVPGLANRMLMKHARVVATGMAFEGDKPNWEWVGIPIAPEFKRVSKTQKAQYKRMLGFDPEKPLVMITGGSQGAQHINYAIRDILPELLKFTSVGLVAGRRQYEEMADLKKYETWDKAKLTSNFRLWNFSPAMNELLGAADLVVSRAGATTIAELATLEKAVILIPFERLPGDHQTKNAEKLANKNAVEMISDTKILNKPSLLLDTIRSLIRSPKRRLTLASNLHEQAKTNAANRISEILINIATK